MKGVLEPLGHSCFVFRLNGHISHDNVISFSVSGRAAVVAFLAGPLIPDQEARLIQANDFVQSEIRWDNATGTGKQHMF